MTATTAQMPVLETDRLSLRMPDARDAEAYIGFRTSERAAMSGGKRDRRDSWHAFASVIGHWSLRGFGLFTAELKQTGEAIGLIGNWAPEGWPEREIGWQIFRDEHEGKGLAFEGARAVHKHVHETLKWDTAVSYIAHGNDRSVALARRLGAVEDPAAALPMGKPCHVFRHIKGACQ